MNSKNYIHDIQDFQYNWIFINDNGFFVYKNGNEFNIMIQKINEEDGAYTIKTAKKYGDNIKIRELIKNITHKLN